jgi:hypothetical protein
MTAMTAQDFELIARVLRVSAPAGTTHEDGIARQQLWRTARLMADALAETNSRFDRKRFLRAAEVSGPTGEYCQLLECANEPVMWSDGMPYCADHAPVGPTESHDVGGEPWREDQT